MLLICDAPVPEQGDLWHALQKQEGSGQVSGATPAMRVLGLPTPLPEQEYLHELIDELIPGLRVLEKCQCIGAPGHTFRSCQEETEK